MSSLSISAAWEQTRVIIARDGSLLAAVALALIVLPELVLAVVGPPVGAQTTMLGGIIYIVVILLGFVAQIALNRLAIGPSVTVGGAIAIGFARLASVVAVFIALMLLVVVVAVVLLIVLGSAGLMTVPVQGQPPPASLLSMLILLVVLVFAVFQLVFPLAAVETANPLRILARSVELARHHYIRLLAFVVVVFVGLGLIVLATQLGVGSAIVILLGKPNPGSMSALVLGLIAGVVQAGFTVVTAVMLARIYLQISRHDDAQASVPKSGT